MLKPLQGKDVIDAIYGSSSNSRIRTYEDDPPEHRLKGFGDALYTLGYIAMLNQKKPEVLHVLSGRVYNHGCSALILLDSAYYDEALNLCRSIAEIANLLSLFDGNPLEFKEWVKASKRERINKFGPYAVRQKLTNNNGHLPVSDDWYGELCETVTHPTPEVFPNSREIAGRKTAYIGSLYDQGKYIDTGHKLLYLLVTCTTYLSSMTDNSDLLVPILESWEQESEYLNTQLKIEK